MRQHHQRQRQQHPGTLGTFPRFHPGPGSRIHPSQTPPVPVGRRVRWLPHKTLASWREPISSDPSPWERANEPIIHSIAKLEPGRTCPCKGTPGHVLVGTHCLHRRLGMARQKLIRPPSKRPVVASARPSVPIGRGGIN